MSLVKEMLSDADGTLSTTRVVAVVWAFGVLAVWATYSIYTHQIADIPGSVQTIMGTLFAAKVIQKPWEKSADEKATSEQAPVSSLPATDQTSTPMPATNPPANQALLLASTPPQK